MSFNPQNIAIIGTSGAIGGALTKLIREKYSNAMINTFSSKGSGNIDYQNEDTIARAAEMASKNAPLDMVIAANGILHQARILPEKSLKDLSAEKFLHIFEANAIVPALVAKHFLPKLNSDKPSRFAAFSARVGSLSDNQLGGWYSYRASKAALNMIIKNAAIEIGRRNKGAVIVGLHPGTVDSNLSKPFQANVPAEKLFSPDYAAHKLLSVLENLTPEKSGKCFAWDGKEIMP